ncbi:hypothetical protein VOLCADRAFT_119148 [Volvox carteri f. nagariensis]|uniref:RING-type domain-containing protein n=1 Tax=Volvox carteri f. nagariensis TaxID=3068 RepID=D8UAM4_VOLCA|nr:uncharacterized protein VOLCADRAFT_119148 [Volvox carteri f. nagariensis]EFJ43132.1 hypothetical protein VOLCADRAFT_119148 [Volvox carteri f. nagariensis]|eukprot:XP_002955707.1 hypothetical protein VOLCADRAFT_119148 [Volvox carteri f. nagariensis]
MSYHDPIIRPFTPFQPANLPNPPRRKAHMWLRDAHQLTSRGVSTGGSRAAPPGTSLRTQAADRAAGVGSGLPLHHLPVELALSMSWDRMDRLGRGGSGSGSSGGGGIFLRPYTPGAASEGGRSTLPYDYEQLLSLDAGALQRVVRPEVIRGLPKRTAQRSDASQQCHVCLERFTPGRTSITTLPCTHAFCSDCIRPWLASHTTCPVCRWTFPEGHTKLVAAAAEATAG